MPSKQEELELIVRARNEATATLTSFNSELLRSIDAMKQFQSQTTQNHQALPKTQAGAEGVMGALNGMAGAYRVVTGGIVVTAAVQAGRYAVELQNVAERAGQVRRMFENVTGTTADMALPELRQDLRGAADDMFLLQATSKLMALGFADSVGEAGDLLSMVTQLGRAFKGLNAEQTVENLLPLLSNQSALRLDEFGVSGAQVKALQDRYEAMGMESGEAFKQAFIEQAQLKLEQIGIQEPTTAEREAATWANVKTTMAESANSGWIGDALSWARNDIIRGLQEDMQRNAQYAENKPVIQGAIDSAGFLFESGRISQEATLQMGQGLGELNTMAHLMNTTTEDLRAEIDALAGSIPGMSAAWAEWHGLLGATNDDMGDLGVRLQALDGRNYVATVTINQVTVSEAAQAGMGVGMDPWLVGRQPNQGRTFERTMADAVSADDQALQDIRDGWADVAKASASGYDQYMAELERQRQEIESMVDSVFAASTVTAEDVLATKMGAYRDKPDEYIRRLTDAVNNKNSPYAGYLGGRGGDEAQFYLMQQTQAWQAGQWEQLGPGFNREESIQAMVDQVMSQYQAKQSRQAILDEVMNRPEIAALGLNTNTVKQSLGMDVDWASEGADQAAALVSGMASTNGGTQAADSFLAQMRAKEAEYKTLGEDMMTWVAEGARGAMNTALVDALIDALAPGIAEKLAGRK